MAEISKITLPSGVTYDIKDATARATLSGAIKIKGTTTTALTDEATTNPIKINNADYTAIANDAVFYAKKEYVFDGTKWHEFGDMSGLGALAYKNSASTTYTPAGDVTAPTFNGTQSSVTITATDSTTGNYQPKGTVSAPAFTGESTTFTGSYTPAGGVELSNSNKTAAVSPASSGTVTYTPAGDVSAPTISVDTTGATTTINNPTAKNVMTALVTAAPGTTAPTNAITCYSVTGEILMLNQIGYAKADSITTSNVTVKTGDATYTASTPTFSGKGVRLVTGNISVPTSASFNGTEASLSVSGTPLGHNATPTFTGSKAQLSGTTTATGTVTAPTFSGTQATITVS